MSEPIRILHVGLTSNRGGVESFVMNIYRNIDRSKVQFDFLVDHDKILPYEDEIASLGGHIYHEYYYFRERKKADNVKLSTFFNKHPEIYGVHVHANGINTLFRVIKEAKKHKVSLRILHSHNNGYMYKFNFKQKIYETYVHMIRNYYVTDYLACSQEAGEWMFGNRDKFTVIPNSIDVSNFFYNPDKRKCIREQLHITEDEVVIGFAGSFNYQKDPMFIVAVFNELTKLNSAARMLMLGNGSLYNDVQNEINKLGLANKVICLGNVSNVSDYMQAMDVFLLPSRFEGFGIVLLEAQSAGLPCVTSKTVVPQSVNITGTVTFISKNESPEKWAEQMNSIPIKRFDTQDVMLNSQYCISKLINKMYIVYKVTGEKNE